MPARAANFHHTAARDILELLNRSARPGDFHFPCLGFGAKTEPYQRLARGCVSYAGGAVVEEVFSVGQRHANARADSVAIALRASQMKGDPMIRRTRITQQARRRPDRRNHNVHSAILVEIGEGRASIETRSLKIPARSSRDILEPAVSRISKNAVGERCGPAEQTAELGKVGVGEKKIFPSVVIEI